MPKVIVTHRPFNEAGGKEIENCVIWLSRNLPALVAEHLGVRGTQAELSPFDIEVRFEQLGPYDVFGNYVIGIDIRANDYAERRVILKSGAKKIWDAVNKELPFLGGEFFVWPQLSLGEFAEGPIAEI